MSPRTIRTPGRRAASRRRGRASTLAIGAAAIVVLAIASVIGYRAADTVPGREYYNLQAEFTEADNLSNHYEVRIGGLRAGQVLNPRVKDGKAVVDIRLDKKYQPLRSDSTVQVRLRSAIGVRYLEITPGRDGEPLPEGGLLRATNQEDNVAVDQALGTLDPTTRDKARTFLNALGEGADDNGPDLNLALRRFAPFLRDVQTLAEPLNDQAGITARFLRNTNATVGAFDGIRQTLAQSFTSIERGLRPFADDADRIGETLDEAAPTLTQVQRQLPEVDRLVAAVDGFAVDGRPALRQAPAALRETTRLMRASRPALRQAERPLDLLKAATDPTVNALQTLQPQLGRVDTAFNATRPILRELGAHACAIPGAFSAWGEWVKYGTAHGTYIRFTVTENVFDALTGGTDPGKVNGYQRFGRSIPYPGPCAEHGNVPERGGTFPPPRESAQGLTYSSSFPVIR